MLIGTFLTVFTFVLNYVLKFHIQRMWFLCLLMHCKISTHKAQTYFLYYVFFNIFLFFLKNNNLQNNKRNIRRHIFCCMENILYFLDISWCVQNSSFHKVFIKPNSNQNVDQHQLVSFFIFSGKISYDTEHISFGYYFVCCILKQQNVFILLFLKNLLSENKEEDEIFLWW